MTYVHATRASVGFWSLDVVVISDCLHAAMSSLPEIGEMLHEHALQNFVDFNSSPASITKLEDDKENTERVTVDAVASNYNVLYHLMSHHPKQRHLPKKDLIKGLQAADHAVDYKMSGARTNSLYWARDEAEKLIMLWSYVWTCAKRSKASRNARLQKLKYLLQDSADDDDEYPEVTAEDGPEDGAEEVDDEADGNQAPPEEVDDEADGNQAPLALEDGVMDLVSDGEVECSCEGGSLEGPAEGKHNFRLLHIAQRAGFWPPEDTDDDSLGYPESDDDDKDL